MAKKLSFDRKKLTLLLGAVFGLIVIITIIAAIIKSLYSVELSILVVPQSSTITINGELYQNGDYHIKPGQYQVSISRDGFKTYQETFTVQANETKKLYLALTPTEDNADWFSKHPEDLVLMDPIKSYTMAKDWVNLKQKYPLVEELPIIVDYYRSYTTERVKYEISYQEISGRIIVMIYDYTGNNYEHALTKIESLGYDPNDYAIEYIERIGTD